MGKPKTYLLQYYQYVLAVPVHHHLSLSLPVCHEC